MLEPGPQVHGDDDPAALAGAFHAEVRAHARAGPGQGRPHQLLRDDRPRRPQPVGQQFGARVADPGAEHVQPVLRAQPLQAGDGAHLPGDELVQLDHVEGDDLRRRPALGAGRGRADVDGLPDPLHDGLAAADERGVVPRGLVVRHGVGPLLFAQRVLDRRVERRDQPAGVALGADHPQGHGPRPVLGGQHQQPGAEDPAHEREAGEAQQQVGPVDEARPDAQCDAARHRGEEARQQDVAQEGAARRGAGVAGDGDQVEAQGRAEGHQPVPGQFHRRLVRERLVQVRGRAQQPVGGVVPVGDESG
ncbi:hypothetical protein D1J60_27790 [Streptomyces sp. W1SF4]|nr:hypothetical protein D1J60_27790 [Streptomyces sp. W1SF4]